MKTVVLVGKQNTGKSETLRKLAEMFCVVLTPKVRAEITIILKNKNKNIVITSKGDCTRDIKNEFVKVKKNISRIDVFVSACHPTNKNCFAYLKQCSSKVIIINKTVSKNRSMNLSTNIKDAKTLFRSI